jgi:GT2 family glycosyltransferase
VISALVVNRNGERWLDRCLGSLGVPAPAGLEVWLVDNASSDRSLELVRERFPHVRVLRMAHNVGFAVANNLAAACAVGETLLLLNDDAWIEPGALDRLHRRLESDPSIALVAPRLVSPAGRPRFSWSSDRGLLGEAVQRLRNPFEGNALNHGPVEGLLRRVLGPGWYTAACVLIRRRAFDEVAGFDPAFFLYFEDADLCVRLRERGWRLVQEPDAVAVHVGGRGALDPATELHYRQSQVHYYSKHRPRFELRMLHRLLTRRYPEGPVHDWLVDERTERRLSRREAEARDDLARAASAGELEPSAAARLRSLLDSGVGGAGDG